MTKIIFVSSPYTKGDQAKNVRTSIFTAEKVRNLGYLPFAPLLSHFWDIISPHPRVYWMEMCLEWIRQCDAVLRLPGESKGADEEVALARELDKPVFYSIESLMKATWS